MLGAFKARAAPFNVNYRYVAEELRYLLDERRRAAPSSTTHVRAALAEVRDRLPALEVLLQVAGRSGESLLPGAVDYEEALAGRRRADRGRAARPTTSTSSTPAGRRACRKACCGAGTTSSSQPWAGAPCRLGHGDELRAARRAGGRWHGPQMMLPPLMHGAAQWAAFTAIAEGATIILAPTRAGSIQPTCGGPWSVSGLPGSSSG